MWERTSRHKEIIEQYCVQLPAPSPTSNNFIAGQMNLDMIMEAENNLKKVLKEAKESQATASNNDECQDFIKNIMEGKSMMCMKKYRDSVI